MLSKFVSTLILCNMALMASWEPRGAVMSGLGRRGLRNLQGMEDGGMDAGGMEDGGMEDGGMDAGGMVIGADGGKLVSSYRIPAIVWHRKGIRNE